MEKRITVTLSFVFSLFYISTCHYWKPEPLTSWHIQYEGNLLFNLTVDAYDIDLFDTTPETINELHNNGSKVICYFSAGTYEDWRPDISSFPPSVLGNNLEDWPGEKYLDIRATSILMPIMESRMDLAVSKGCDAVDPDNVDAFENDSGFPLTGEDQLTYNKLIANAAHTRHLAVSLKNDLGQIEDLIDYFDFMVNEECHQYDECGELDPFIQANKAVFIIEYELKPQEFCPSSNASRFTAQLKDYSLNGYFYDCLTTPNPNGTINFAYWPSSSDSFFEASDNTTREWYNTHIDRIVIENSPLNRTNTSWYTRGWLRESALYSIPNPSTLAANNPDWILRDKDGNKLYLPVGCNGTTCPWYAPDVGNPAYAQYYVNRLNDSLKCETYKGILVGNISFDILTADVNGTYVEPIDPRTNNPVTYDSWGKDWIQFLTNVTNSFAPSGYEIVHDTDWSAGNGTAYDRFSDPFVDQQARLANITFVRGGVNSDLNATGNYSFDALLAYVDGVHARGAGVYFGASQYGNDTYGQNEYQLAFYFLVSNGKDYVSSVVASPENWWEMFDKSLGSSTTKRYKWNNIWRRNFSDGIVLVSPPGTTQQTLILDDRFRNTSGEIVTEVTLGQNQGAVLFYP